MEIVPWFAWIAIAAIIMWGLVMIFGKSSNIQGERDEEQQREIDSLRRRIEDLEAQLYRRG